MEIRTKGELLAALELGQIHLQTCDDLELSRSFVEKTTDIGENSKTDVVSITYILRFTTANYINTKPKRVRIRKLSKR